jgi:hypothetical protein
MKLKQRTGGRKIMESFFFCFFFFFTCLFIFVMVICVFLCLPVFDYDLKIIY